MKVLPLLILVRLLSVIQSTAADSRISDIRADYEAIRNALPTLKEERITLFECSTTEGCEAKAYRDARGSLRYMRVEFFYETGKAIEEYYVRDGRLIFMYRGIYRYNVPFYLTPERAKEIGSDPFDPQKTTVAEERYYFHDSKMIRWIDIDKKEISSDSIDFKEAERAVLSSFRAFVSKIK